MCERKRVINYDLFLFLPQMHFQIISYIHTLYVHTCERTYTLNNLSFEKEIHQFQLIYLLRHKNTYGLYL